MTLYVLDTDHISLYQKSHSQVVARLKLVAPSDLAVTVVNAEEQLRGWFDAIRQAKSGERLHWAYLGLRQGIEYFNTIRVLDFSQEALNRYLALRSAKIRIGTQDLRIAAIVLAFDGTLVTRNRRDFAQVPELKIEDWT
jgi:tRNA(fMet)-specific endonuclease VapC